MISFTQFPTWSESSDMNKDITFSLVSSVAQSCPTLQPHELQHTRPPCLSSTPGVDSNSCPLIQSYHPTISSSVILFSSHPQTFPASGFFPMSQFFTPGGQSIRVSSPASVLPMNIQDWFPLGWTLLWITLYFWCLQMWISLPSFKNVFSIFLIIKYIYKYK